MRRGWLLVVLLLVLLLVVPGGVVLTAVTLKLARDRAATRRALRDAATRYGLRPDYVDAIGWVESRWDVAAVNMAGTDGARGGAHGVTQITERTARDHGYTGTMEALRKDAVLAADWTGRILSAAHKRRPLTTLADYAAAWNAGRDNADKNDNGQLEELPVTHSTRAHYLPRATAALAIVAAIPV